MWEGQKYMESILLWRQRLGRDADYIQLGSDDDKARFFVLPVR